MRHGIIDDLRKTLSELRKKLQSAGFANAETLVPQRGNLVAFFWPRVVWTKGYGVDICGYLVSANCEGKMLKCKSTKGFKVNPV